MTALIGITGRARAGKTTFARILCQEHGFSEVTFAGPLKLMVACLFRTSVGHLEITKDEVDYRIGRTPREVLQAVGTEGVRHLDPDFLVKLAMRRAAEILPEYPVVITDVRFENEAAAIRDKGGLIVHIMRPEGPTIATSEHVSERGIQWLPGDAVAVNDRGPGHLMEAAPNVVNAAQHVWAQHKRKLKENVPKRPE